MKEAEKYIKHDPYFKRLWKSRYQFLKHYWKNTGLFIGFSVLALIAFVYFLHIDQNPTAFWWCVGVLMSINAIRFVGLLIKWRV